MKVAIPSNEDKKTVCVSFGRAPLFMLIETENNHREFISNKAADSIGAAGIQAAQFLVDNDINVLLTPRCGENAAKVFNAANIDLYKTVSSDIEEEVKSFMDNNLEILTEIHSGFHNSSFGEEAK